MNEPGWEERRDIERWSDGFPPEPIGEVFSLGNGVYRRQCRVIYARRGTNWTTNPPFWGTEIETVSSAVTVLRVRVSPAFPSPIVFLSVGSLHNKNIDI